MSLATTAPCAAASPPAQAASAARAPLTHFDLNEIRVDGNTVLPQEQIEETIYPFLGPGRTADDVEAARRALQDAYTKSGFVTVSVERAHWVDRNAGVIGVNILERRVGRLRVVGAHYFLPSDVRAGAPSLAPGTVPNMSRVKADLLGLNQLPDRTVQPNLKPSRNPDIVDVDLDVTDKDPLHGSLELNNRYNADTTHLRLNASLTYDNFFQRGDSGTINYSVAPEDVRDAEIESASYLFHVPDSKLSVLLTYLHSNSNVTALGTTDVVGRGSSAGFRVLIPLGTQATGNGSFTHSFSVGWDYKRFFELDNFLTNNTHTFAPVTYYPLNAAYAANWTGPHSTTDLNASLEANISRLGSEAAQFENKRYDATPGFSLARLSLTRQQDLPWHMQLWASLSGQLSNDPLVSSEQFGLGGADSVRGYLEAETLGDYGATLQTELRSPDIHQYLGSGYWAEALDSWRFHIFGDAGEIHNLDVLPETRTSYTLSSAGVGTRVNLWGYLNGSVQDAITFASGQNTRAGTNRVLFRVFGEF